MLILRGNDESSALDVDRLGELSSVEDGLWGPVSESVEEEEEEEEEVDESEDEEHGGVEVWVEGRLDEDWVDLGLGGSCVMEGWMYMDLA